MKTWEKYSEYLQTGQWHVHTTYADGLNTIDEYCSAAEQKGIPLLAFTEHVRTELDYDFDAFLSELEGARERYEIIILSGCEAKVLPDGELDVDREILAKVDYCIFAFHSFPKDIELYVKNLKKIIKNPKVNAWAHPGQFLVVNQLTIEPDELSNILALLKENRVLLEENSRYQMPPPEWLDHIKGSGVLTVRGGDVHSVAEL